MADTTRNQGAPSTTPRHTSALRLASPHGASLSVVLFISCSVAALLANAGCGDAALPAAPDGGAAPNDVSDDGAVLTDGDAVVATDAATDPDAATATATDTDATTAPDTDPDAATDPDATGDTGVPQPDPCGDCPVGQQPAGEHPGAKAPYAITLGETVGYGGGIGQGYKDILVIKPVAPGVRPTLFFVPGKQLSEGGGFIGELGQPYRALLDHVAGHGYNVAFVRVEQNALDGDHERMATDLLDATNVYFAKVSTADPTKVVFAGHSMGAKVAFLAAWKTLATDMDGQWVDPAAVLCFALANDKPAFGAYTSAVDKAKQIVAEEPTRFTFIEADDDTIAPWNDPAKPNAGAVYAAMPTQLKQIIVLHGTGDGDKNAKTSPELHDDHSAPLTIEGKPSGIAGWTLPASHLDALDWYGYWKFVVGAMQVAFDGGDEKWAYGDLRSHGGTRPDGTVVQHEIAKQGW